jgi:hypothetical protein
MTPYWLSAFVVALMLYVQPLFVGRALFGHRPGSREVALYAAACCACVNAMFFVFRQAPLFPLHVAISFPIMLMFYILFFQPEPLSTTLIFSISSLSVPRPADDRGSVRRDARVQA